MRRMKSRIVAGCSLYNSCTAAPLRVHLLPRLRENNEQETSDNMKTCSVHDSTAVVGGLLWGTSSDI